MPLTVMAHAGLSCGLGLLVGGLAGGVVGTGVGLIWFWGPPLALAASAWLRDVVDWDTPLIHHGGQRTHEPALPHEDTPTVDGPAD